jgi:hypothetical protein
MDGVHQRLHQREASAAVRAFAHYGETTGETDEFGLPVRYPWAAEYRGNAAVVYGHTPVPEAEWLLADACELSSLEEAGIERIFTPGASTTEIVDWLNQRLSDRRAS